ncbi:MAG: hypothetical protein KAQ87_05540, partial [Candidatus Pacebacteria bacterium]|nr:hypothetical protein [Candidatus Paceibacterota bacterium]
MVEEIKKLIQKVKSEKGDIILFMLWKDIADFDKWSVIISANWIDKIEQRKALNYWLILLQKSLSNKDLDSIGRISFLKSHDRFVKLFTSALNVSGGPMYFKNSEVGNYYIHDAIIFEAKKTILPKKQNIYQKNPTLNGSINPNI